VEEFKRLDTLLDADARNLHFGGFSDTGEFANISLMDHYAIVAEVVLHDGVPEDVRSYFNVIKNLCVFGWYVYGFYALCDFLSMTAIELALNIRFPHAAKQKPPLTLRPLLELARQEGLLRDENFEAVQQERGYGARAGEGDVAEVQDDQRHVRIVTDTLPRLRNWAAHPTHHSVLLPSDARAAVQRSAEIINQLFKRVP
jgi:hypothetical protein